MALGILLQSRSRRGRLVRGLGGRREPEKGGKQEREPERDGRQEREPGPHDRRVQGLDGQRVCTQGTGRLPRISHRPHSHHSQPRKQHFALFNFHFKAWCCSIKSVSRRFLDVFPQRSPTRSWRHHLEFFQEFLDFFQEFFEFITISLNFRLN